MSAGAQVNANYKADNATSVYAASCQPETLGLTVDQAGGGTLTNTGSTDSANQDVSLKISKGKRELGAGPRTVTFKFSDPLDVPEGYDPRGSHTLPVFVRTFWEAVQRNATGTYQGKAIIYGFKQPESIR